MIRSKLTGFDHNSVNLSKMKDVEIKKVIFIGDGMSGKTQIILSFANLIILYLQKIFTSYASGEEMTLQQADALLNDKSFEVYSNFKHWAEKNGFLIQYGRAQWNLSEISLDTETIGFEDFHFSFPYFWNDETYRIKLTGSDVGGQNIFDHMRNVLGKFAGANDVMVVVFDRSRAFSCWNSIEQVRNVIGEKLKIQTYEDAKNIPRVLYVGNKTDLEEHIRSQKWRAGVQRFFINMVKKSLNYRKGEYSLPSLVRNERKERIIQYKLKGNEISFPDLEAFIYNSIRKTDPHYGRIMTEVNSKALAREIAAQLVFNKKVDEYRIFKGEINEIEMVQIMNDFGKILFQRRPLAIQYSGGVELEELEKGSESDSFERVRMKWDNYYLDLQKINDEEIESACMSGANARSFLSEMGNFYSTNALEGTGVLEFMDDIIKKKIKLTEKNIETAKKDTVIRRKIKRF